MSGSNQHNLPQMLQRGFQARGARGQTWLFKPSTPSCLERIANIGAGDGFYSDGSADDDEDLDSQITTYESERFGALLHRLKSAPSGSQPAAQDAAEIVGHLTVRAGHFRTVVTEGFLTFIQTAVELFSREEVVSGFFGFDAGQPTERFSVALQALWDKHPEIAQTGIPLATVNKMALALVRENFCASWPEHVDNLEAMGAAWSVQSIPMVRDSHNRALAEDFSGGVRKTELEAFVWELVQVHSLGVILPDCAAIAVVEGRDPLPFMMADREKLIGVVAPLASGRLLVGRRPDSPRPDLTDINRRLAACSHEFFIAATNPPAFEELRQVIGQQSQVVFEEATDGALKRYDRPTPGQALEDASSSDDEDQLQVEDIAPPDFPYQLSFLGCASEEQAHEIFGHVGTLVRALGSMIPLERLDGITFAADYPAALSALDRGMPGWGPPTTIPEDQGVGLAQSPLVMRDGVLKARIIVQGWVGNGLLSEDEQHVKFAIHTLAYQLAVVSGVAFTENALPGALLGQVTGLLNKLLYKCISAEIDDYWAASFSAPFAPDSTTDLYRAMATEALRKLHALAPDERFAYRLHADMDQLLGAVLPAVTSFLSHTAALVGHCDGRGEPPAPEGSEFAQALEQAGLKLWLPTFQSDLAAFWARRGRWASFDEFFSFTKHVERLLWQYALIPWETDDEQVHVTVPLGVDAPALQALVTARTPEQSIHAEPTPES